MFTTEPQGYEKTVLSELQGAWLALRDDIVKHPFDQWDKSIFHIDEAMSWESVRNLRHMEKCLLLVRNIILKSDANDDILDALDQVSELMAETLKELNPGKLK